MEGTDRADKRANEAGNGGGRKESWADVKQAGPSAMPESTEAGRSKTEDACYRVRTDRKKNERRKSRAETNREGSRA